MVMTAGTAARDELIAGLDRGLLVTRFHYTNPVHPKLAIVTGMTRDGTFLVEDGKIVAPVRNLRYTQSYLDALAGITAVGRRAADAEGVPRRASSSPPSASTAGRSRGRPSTSPGSTARREGGTIDPSRAGNGSDTLADGSMPPSEDRSP